MSIQTVTAVARTRGKSPQNFEYQAIGKLTERVIPGKPATEAVPEVVDPETGEVLEDAIEASPAVPDSIVHDIDVSALADVDFDELSELFSRFVGEGQTLEQVLKLSLAEAYNRRSRNEASPTVDPASVIDELAPYIDVLVESGHLSSEKSDITTFKRGLTMAAGMFGLSKFESFAQSLNYKKAIKAGVVFPAFPEE